MEALYAKLYDKYTTLKTKKESEWEQLNLDQEEKFMSYVSAADRLIEHLRNEYNRLHAQVDDLKSEVASVRSSKVEELEEYQKILIEENQKNKNLEEEIERLRNLQREGLGCSDRGNKNETGQLNTPGGSQVRPDAPGGVAMMTRKRSRHSGTDAEVTGNQFEHTTPRESADPLSKEAKSGGTILDVYEPNCRRQKIGTSGGAFIGSSPSPTSCVFQDLVECLVGMKLSVITEADEKWISAIHQSSGYSFSLLFIENSRAEAELLYRVTSLGTFEKVAPEWMGDMIRFSLAMCPTFFERVLRLVKLGH